MEKNGQIQIIDAIGRNVFNGELKNINGVGIADINISGLPAGQYTAYIIVGERKGSKKLIIR